MLLCAAPAGCYSVVGRGLQSGRMGLVGSRLLRLYSSPPGLDDDTFGEDTIYALSTSSPPSALAIVRLSGPDSIPTLQKLTSPSFKVPPPRKMSLAKLFHPKSKVPLDEGMAVIFKGPKSFTGEDVVELHIHGSRGVVDGVIEAVSDSGLRAAERGEFTSRAFQNDKLSLLEVESLHSLLTSQTSTQRVLALSTSSKVVAIYDSWRDVLIKAMSHTEAIIDFSSDSDNTDLQEPELIYGGVLDSVKNLRKTMERHLEDGYKGELITNGVKVCLTGLPNAGKSSIINILAERDVSIVSSTPGTTRDVVTVQLDLGGVLCLVSDTAGLREGDDVDEVETEGVKRALRVREEADVVVEVVGLDRIEEGGDGKEGDDVDLKVFNKADLRDTEGNFDGGISISCVSGEGVDELISKLTKVVKDRVGNVGAGAGAGTEARAGENASEGSDDVIITKRRHREHVETAWEALCRFEVLALEGEAAVDLASEELRVASVEIGRIVGRVDVEDVLDSLFNDFCVGK
ncbi:hypothetical protein TrVE_jg13816 [Triparma verrucosa]|uniref:TrmE-type G domain-containing protein n=1 Tax=Triparma verrucosa TaxID=1606542 RepID=A0A9W7CDG2_9STRA|nr:hypothetical protein TrVE_jg13816 [Triparma verrucosa]